MKIQLLLMGKTRFPFILEGLDEYMKRLKRYTDIRIRELPDLKNTGSWSQSRVMQEEGKHIIKALSPKDYVVLLDERGKEMGSIGFAEFIDRRQQESMKSLVFVIGGAYGFSPEVYERGDMLLSLSKMTFSHQMIPLFFIEQLYRAYSIIKGTPYHHD
ncbi:23S rRNA (pseudouridine(1915)-N(3))-methyltransferase RlmH [Bacteroidota bacterium]